MSARPRFKQLFPPLWWQFMLSRHDFLLRIAPNTRYKCKDYDQSHYPPPGYGLPPGSSLHNNKRFIPTHQYALFLFPGKLAHSFLWFSILLPLLIFLPVFDVFFPLPFFSFEIPAYAFCIFSYWLFSYLFYLILYHYLMPPVLSSVWEKWPVPANHLFLSVPHQVSVYEKWDTEQENIYWQPDEINHLYRQTSEFAPDTQSLQEILLNFAVFEFFFKRPNPPVNRVHETRTDANDTLADNPSVVNPPAWQQVPNKAAQAASYEKIIKEKEWYTYLFTPVWMNYGLIIIALLFLVLLPVCSNSPDRTWIPFANLPYNFIPVILLWLLLSFRYMTKIIHSLENMHRKIRKGAFDAHLELVPQPILQALSNIPEPHHIEAGIQHIKRTMGWISSIALIGFLAIVEIFSQAYGSNPAIFTFGTCSA